MAKDPAVLFYTSDFLAGTAFFTMEEKGQYITLLCEQHQVGHIPKNHMISVCGSDDSPVIKKFVKDENGLYFNKRMEVEKEKRIKYCESRSNNKSGRKKKVKIKSYDKTYDIHMSQHMENGNENENNNTSSYDNKNKSSLTSRVKNKKPEKHKYGEYKHVLLSDDEYQKLIDDYGLQKVNGMIKNLDEGIEIKGYKYKNHNLVIRKWHKNNNKPKEKLPVYTKREIVV